MKLPRNTIVQGDSLAVLRTLPAESVQLVLTSPPYWGLRDYQADGQSLDGQWGREPTPEAHLARMVEWARAVRGVLRKDGVLVINYGEAYAAGGRGGSTGASTLDGSQAWQDPHRQTWVGAPVGLKPKDLLGMPWRLAQALQQGYYRCTTCCRDAHGLDWAVWNGHRVCMDCAQKGERGSKVVQTEPGWWWRAWWPWVKPNGMPESCRDRPALSCEVMLMFTKSARYFWDQEAVRVGYAPASIERADGSQVTTGNPDVRPGFKRTLIRALPAKPRANQDRNDGGATGRDPEAPAAHGRIRKTGDWHRESVALAIEQARQYSGSLSAWADHAEAVLAREDGTLGALLDFDGLPLGQLHPTFAYPGSHFATYPPALVRPIIRAATSERGACPACGAPWVREVEKEFVKMANRREDHTGRVEERNGYKLLNRQNAMGYNETRTTGWRPSCGCEAGEPVPCVVLDPFAGTGTTCVVAAEEGRDSVGIDLYGGEYDFGGHTALDRLRQALGQGPPMETLQAERAGQTALFTAESAEG